MFDNIHEGINLFTLVIAHEVQMVHHVLQNFVLRDHRPDVMTNRTMINTFGDVALLTSFREIFDAVFASSLIALFTFEIFFFEGKAQLALEVLGKLH